MSLALRCTEGPLAGELIEIDHELLLGRELPGPAGLGGDPRLSRHHARVSVQGSRILVEDLGSTNGTWVNGERLTAPRRLDAGDQLRLGQTCLEVCETGQHAATVVDGVVPVPTPDTPVSQPRLEIMAGPMSGQEIALGSELAIGRGFGEPSGLGGDRLLSRRHARIARAPDGVYFIEDTGSTNGTVLNGERVRQAHLLGDGDEIKVGSSRLIARGLPRAPVTAEPAGESVHWPAAERSKAREFAPQGAAPTRLGSRRLILVFASAFGASLVIAIAAVVLAAPPGSRTCPSGFICHKPTTAPPLQSLAAFRGALGWHAEYDPQMLRASTADAAGNQLVLHESDQQDRAWGLSPGTDVVGIEVRAFPAAQTSADAAMKSLASTLSSTLVGAAPAPNSDQMFSSPALGFHSGVGEVLEGNAQTPQGPGGLIKVATLAATSGNVTIAVGMVYSVQHSQNQQSNPDRVLDILGDQVIETVRFPSDGAT